MVFTLIPAVSILAQGGKDSSKGKPFPALEESADEGEIYYLSEMIDDDDDDEASLAPETTAVSEGGSPITVETTAVNESKLPVIPEITGVNESRPSSVPKKPAVSEEYKGVDKNSRGSADANTTVSAAESAAAAAQFAAAAAQSAKAAESAAAAAAAAVAAVPSQAQPPAVQPQPAPSRLPPQPPVRTIAPTVNIIVPSAPPPAAPPAYQPSMKITPGMPDPSGNGVYRVQVGSFSNTGLAQQCFNRLKAAGFTPFYEQYGSLYRVVITGVQAADMAGVIRRLESAGFTDAWIREER